MLKTKKQTMNTAENTTGAVENAAVNNTPKTRGRPRNPNVTRKIYLTDSNTPRKQGSPKPGSTVKFVIVQASVKNSEYVHGTTPIVGEVGEETVAARTYKAKVTTVNPAPVTATETTATSPMANMDEVKPVDTTAAVTA